MQSALPTWDDQITALFKEPYWIPAADRETTAAGWNGCMNFVELDIQDYEVVKKWSVTIYNHLVSQTMPLTSNPAEYWPPEALELFRIWVNQGCRKTANDSFDRQEHISSLEQPIEPQLRIRRDINTLTDEELNTYRMKLEEIGIQDVCADSPWQKLAYIHTDWCLHYQEAFLLWHRAFLLHLEELIDFPIPYWNWTSPETTQDGNPEAGLPQAFLDETYSHPVTGEVRLNPLRYAIAKDGKSKACYMKKTPPIDRDCKYVQRDSVLYTTGDDCRQEREEKYARIGLYQRQVVNALMWPIFSKPEGFPGMPWQNIPSFEPPPPDKDYPNRCDFDGIYEQPHDNIHGWIGPDMADNAYTAFDPVFWSHHSNIDRIFENWKRAHPDNMYTANFPLRPFIGKSSKEQSLTDPRPYIYTTIGDMVRDSRALGYSYQRPEGNDISRTDYEEYAEHLWVVFEDARCTKDTYTLDLFINQPNPRPKDTTLRNPNYIGKILRLGMGSTTNTERCITTGVTRIIDISYTANALNLNSSSTITIDMIVTDVTTHEVLSPDTYKKLPGFIPTYSWGPSLELVRGAAEKIASTSCLHRHTD